VQREKILTSAPTHAERKVAMQTKEEKMLFSVKATERKPPHGV
jgi:hypothetical protein